MPPAGRCAGRGRTPLVSVFFYLRFVTIPLLVYLSTLSVNGKLRAGPVRPSGSYPTVPALPPASVASSAAAVVCGAATTAAESSGAPDGWVCPAREQPDLIFYRSARSIHWCPFPRIVAIWTEYSSWLCLCVCVDLLQVPCWRATARGFGGRWMATTDWRIRCAVSVENHRESRGLPSLLCRARTVPTHTFSISHVIPFLRQNFFDVSWCFTMVIIIIITIFSMKWM